jgi:hypothetical protein
MCGNNCKHARKVKDQVSKAFLKAGNGVRIPLMAIPKVYAHGATLVSAGFTGDDLAAKLGEFLKTLEVR